MKKRINLLSTILLSVTVLSLSSCLKDSRYVDFSKSAAIVEFPLGGKSNYGPDAITQPNDTITKQIAVNVASTTPPTTATKVTLSVNDPAIINAYKAADPSVDYLPFPADAFALSATSITIPAGQRVGIVTLTIYKNKLDPSLSYMLPVAITNAGGLTISGSKSVHYYHVIGNDFAGVYQHHFFDRWSIPDSTRADKHDNNHVDKGPITFFPVSPTEFTVTTFYYTSPPYHVTFTKTGIGAAKRYSNFQVSFTAADIDAYFTQPSSGAVALADPPKIRSLHYDYNPNTQYTYDQALQLFRFYYTTLTRAVIDTYVKQ
ncbi:hypothetical protein BH09BAC6_BH09BAC6_03730 [soil metagenome]